MKTAYCPLCRCEVEFEHKLLADTCVHCGQVVEAREPDETNAGDDTELDGEVL